MYVFSPLSYMYCFISLFTHMFDLLYNLSIFTLDALMNLV